MSFPNFFYDVTVIRTELSKRNIDPSNPCINSIPFSILIVVFLVSRLVILSLKETVVYFGGGPIDKFLGAIFGTIRGTIIIITLALLGAMTALPNENAWKNAKSRSFLESSVYCINPFLPEFFRSKIILPEINFNEISNLCVLSSE